LTVSYGTKAKPRADEASALFTEAEAGASDMVEATINRIEAMR
jgi:hypothetical protein